MVALPATAEPAIANKVSVTDEAVIVSVAQQQWRVAWYTSAVAPYGLLVVAVLAAASGTAARRRIAAGFTLGVRPAWVTELAASFADATMFVISPAADADVPASTVSSVAVDAGLV